MKELFDKVEGTLPKIDFKKELKLWDFIIEANRFLYRMVRIIVGMMMKVASGREEVEVFLDALEGGERPKVWLAPPQGLTLLEVIY